MMNQKFFRPVLNVVLLTSALAALSACDWFKGSGCASCDSHMESAAPGDVLLTIDGKPAITKAKLDDFFEAYMKNRPDAAYAAMDPQAKRNAFNELQVMEVMSAKIKKDGKDKSPEYKKAYQRAIDLAKYSVNAELLSKEVLDSIDTSDAGLETFYKDLRGKNPAFDNPPFLKQPAGIKIQSVQFSDKKSAEDFLAKAQKAGANFGELAKAIKKDVKNLGLVTSASKVDYSVKAKAKTLEPNAVDIVTTQGNQFMVIRGVGPRQDAQYAELAEIIAAQPMLKEQLANYKKNVEAQTEFMKRIEEWKKELNIVENTKFFEEEEARKKAELEEKFKELKAAQETDKATAGKTAEAEKKPDVAAKQATAQAA